MAQRVGHDQAGKANVSRTALLNSAGVLVEFLARVLPSQMTAPPDDLFTAPPRQAAVLVPLYAREDRPHLLFTRRAPTLARHSGEISFPGGARDRVDATLTDTALRESEEELGINPSSVVILGQLTPVFTVVSNFLINPVVGWLGTELARFTPNPAEVAEVIEAPLADLADPAIFHIEQWQRNGIPHPVYFFQLGSYRIWGATARVVHDLLTMLPA
jgi:8-oxo-dGTP pyrophosphatase MutT (NUDIX family)